MARIAPGIGCSALSEVTEGSASGLKDGTSVAATGVGEVISVFSAQVSRSEGFISVDACSSVLPVESRM